MKELSGSRLFVIAIVCGLIAAGLTVFYMQQVESKYRKAAQPKQEVMVGVVVPRQNMAKGERITKQAMASRQVPKKYLPANVVTAKQFKKVLNRTLLAPLQKGRPMTWESVTGSAAETFSEVVTLGRRAKTIKVNKVDSFDGLLRPGDMIDLMGTFSLEDLGVGSNSNSSMSDEVVMPVLETVEVLEASREDLHGTRYEIKRSKNSADGFNMEFTLITLNLTTKQVARVEMADKTGDLFAVLRHPKDTSVVDYDYLGVELLLEKDTPETVDLVLDENGKPIGRIVGDNIVDAQGNIVGKIVDGKAVSFDGKPLGKIVRNVSADDPVNRVAEVADVVRDADGNIIGRVVDGKIVDQAGNVIGEVKDGKAVTLDGKAMGRIDRGIALDASGNEVDRSKSAVAASVDLVLDKDGKPVGRIVGDNVVDAEGRVIGKIVNGKAVSFDGKPLGKVVKNVRANDPINRVAEIADVVRDANGNIIGRVVDGKIVDKDGNVIGEVKDGKPVSLTGESLGTIEESVALDADGNVVDLSASSLGATQTRRQQVVRDADGNVVGRIVNGQVLDASGKVIGRVDAQGRAVGLDGRKLGSVEEVLVDGRGNIVGREQQVVRDASGKVIGRVVDGKVLDADGNVVGTVGKDGVAKGLNGEVLGRIETAMVDENGEVMASVQEVVRDANGNIIGRVVDGKVVDVDGKVIGTVNSDGSVTGTDGELLGQVEKLMLDKDGRPIDKAVEVVRDANGNVIGLLVDGKVVDKNGKVLGILKNGQVIDADGEVLFDGASVSSESATAVAAEWRASDDAKVSRSIRVVDFIGGGSGKDGITPVVRVRVE